MSAKLWLRMAVVMLGAMLIGAVEANNMPSVPNELFEALKIDRVDRNKVTPEELHEALVKRYKDPEQGAGKKYVAQYWEPIPYGMYLDPATFYKSPMTNKEIASRKGMCGMSYG